MASKPKVVLDTTIVLQAALNPNGYAGAILLLAEHGIVELYTISKLKEEYRDVLFRKSVRKPNARLTDKIAEEILLKIDI